MLQLNVLQNQWVWLALLIGLALTLAIVLAYLEIWRPRKDEGAESDAPSQEESLPVWFFGYVPWIVTLLIIGAGAFGLVYVINSIMHPPNW